MVLLQNYNMKNLAEAKDFFERDYAEGMNYLIAEQDKKIIALATWKMHDMPKHELAELHKIAVIDEFKGKGIAKKFFEELLKDMEKFYKTHNHKLRKLYVMTHANNERAIAFYKRLGFKKEALLPNHYYQGTAEMVLAMYL